MDISLILLGLFYLLAPAIILYLTKKSSIVKKLGSIVVAYGIGIAMSLLGFLPEGSAQIQDIMTSASVPIAIPLLLFPTKIKEWFSLAGPTFMALIVGLISVVLMVFIGYFLFKPEEDEGFWKVGALLIGVYTGGTPNLASLKAMLDVSNETYLVVHSYDMVFSTLYFLFLITIGQKFFRLFLPAFKHPEGVKEVYADEEEVFDKIFNRNSFWPLTKVFGLAVLILAISAGLASLLPEEYFMIVVILSLSTLALSATFIPGVNKIDKSFDLGMYFILVFSVSVASMVNLKELVSASLDLIYYPAFVIFGSLALQSIISRFTKTDVDTLMITSTALICSPPFVPVVSSVINNRNMLVPGITVGLIGYAVGNYLGFIVGEILQFL
ncbi:DUF819 family protein [Lentimicrobium sp. S6]|uniref:DUF819 family protein n=1 Tax=Lentimicrobium sp. S6 TaxID=2735872 RepID=UPI0015526A6E|nr:DUF819 family protein [Lentimicrobium sp. S6]NPD47406.1 DUF819 family protein [Lentimicrobium sp. S6]